MTTQKKRGKGLATQREETRQWIVRIERRRAKVEKAYQEDMDALEAQAKAVRSMCSHLWKYCPDPCGDSWWECKVCGAHSFYRPEAMRKAWKGTGTWEKRTRQA